MARYTDAKCKLCRREGVKLFLKGDRCFSPKCSFDRRGYAPGEHGQRPRRKQSDFALQLREKQKARRIYGILERQFRKYFAQAERQTGVTGENLLRLLERRLDNVVFRLGYATSRTAARQLVRHGHFTVNGRKVTIPSYSLARGQVVQVADKSRSIGVFKDAKERRREEQLCEWLTRDLDKLSGHIVDMPGRDAIPVNVNEQLIVELYSK
ncbi:MAG: 30S ribosomal protein S4 [Candidatus Latescibacterota bacterium]|nr:MAG: 30S ribosomal protein S4 [Candidatus Latescibacterota bacterium]